MMMVYHEYIVFLDKYGIYFLQFMVLEWSNILL